MKKDSFIFYRSFFEAIDTLPRDIQGEIYRAIVRYGITGEETECLKPIARSLFILMKPQIDANTSRYENGCKGGRPKAGGEDEKPNGNQTETKPKPNGNRTETKPKPNGNQTETKPNGNRTETKPKPNGNQTETKPKPNENDNENDNDNYLKEKGNTGVLPQKKKTQEPPLPKIEKTEKAAYAEYVSMTNAEYAALVERYGEQAAREMIDILDNYKGSNGKKYKSDYRAILSWVAGRWEEQQVKTRQYETIRNVNSNKGGRGFMFSREQQDAILRAADQIPD